MPLPPRDPIIVNWNITYWCNAACNFCLSGEKQCARPEADEVLADTIVERILRSTIGFVRILGGEPFYRRNTTDVLSRLAQAGITLTLSTNGTLIDSRVADALRAIRGSIRYLQVSVYGGSRDTYRSICGSGELFDLAMHGLENLNERGQEFHVYTTVTSQNYADIPDLFRTAIRQGAASYRLSPVAPLGKAYGTWDGVQITPSEWLALLDRLAGIAQSENLPRPIVTEQPVMADAMAERVELVCSKESCRAGHDLVHIEADGTTFPCPFILSGPEGENDPRVDRYRGPSLASATIREAWLSPGFDRFRDDVAELLDNNEDNIHASCRYYVEGKCRPCPFSTASCFSRLEDLRKQAVG